MINVEQLGDEIAISYYNDKKGISLEKIKIPEHQKFNWRSCDPTDKEADKRFKSQYGESVKKQRSFYLDKYRILEFIHQYLTEDARKRMFQYNEPKKWFMDIETTITEGFPSVDNPVDTVLCHTFCNDSDDVYFCGLQQLSTTQREELFNRVQNYFDDPKNYREGYKVINKKFKFKHSFYPSESQMLADLYYKIIPSMPVLTGWNFLKFDIAYLNSRAKRLGVDIKKFSPTSNVYNYSIADKYDKTKRQIVEIPMHRTIIDYMEIFAKWDTSIKIKQSQGLDYVANEVLGLKKLEYSGTLMQFHENDYIGFLAYCAIDTILVRLIDEKAKTFNTMMKLANVGKVPMIESLFASMLLESKMSEKYYRKNTVLIKRKKTENDGESYSGGYVEEPKQGFFSDVTVRDFRSEFPSIALYGNIGLETYIGKAIRDIDIDLDNKSTLVITKYIDNTTGQVKEFDPNTMTYLFSGAVYTKTMGDSTVREIIGDLFSDRVIAKQKGKACDAEIDILKNIKKLMV